jgi:transcription-repair coupling factor (superfamily II helicase)
MMQRQPTYFRMDGGQRLKIMVMLEDYEKRIRFMHDVLAQLIRELPAS